MYVCEPHQMKGYIFERIIRRTIYNTQKECEMCMRIIHRYIVVLIIELYYSFSKECLCFATTISTCLFRSIKYIYFHDTMKNDETNLTRVHGFYLFYCLFAFVKT